MTLCGCVISGSFGGDNDTPQPTASTSTSTRPDPASSSDTADSDVAASLLVAVAVAVAGWYPLPLIRPVMGAPPRGLAGVGAPLPPPPSASSVLLWNGADVSVSASVVAAAVAHDGSEDLPPSCPVLPLPDSLLAPAPAAIFAAVNALGSRDPLTDFALLDPALMVAVTVSAVAEAAAAVAVIAIFVENSWSFWRSVAAHTPSVSSQSSDAKTAACMYVHGRNLFCFLAAFGNARKG